VEAIARTGSGKTAAYALPLIQRLTDNPVPRLAATPRVLVLVPTRELAGQVAAVFRDFGRQGGIRARLAIGGTPLDHQVAAMEDGVDVVIGTPGRVMDLLAQKALHLGAVAAMVLDEADRMLEEGFLDAMAEILPALPAHRQMLLFSATMPPAVAELAARCLHRPQRIVLDAAGETPRQIRQRILFAEPADKPSCAARIAQDGRFRRILFFTRTRQGADRLAGQLRQAGLRAEPLHGDLVQTRRTRTLRSFASGATPCLVATDVAARGIDIAEIDLVVNVDMPETPEAYIHRIGRTGRAGRRGMAITFCGADERAMLRAIEKHLGQRLRVVTADAPLG
ncbi:DEAD/DEAH box helicase, partial [Ameyamaea chiangmaiensis]